MPVESTHQQSKQNDRGEATPGSIPAQDEDQLSLPESGIALPTPISIVIPAYNEELSIGKQLDDIHRVLCGTGVQYEIIVVDDGSHDQTQEKALNGDARVLIHAENRGYGASIKTGIQAAKYDAIIITDADGTYPADQIPALATKLKTADMVVGARIGEDVHIPWIRRPAKRFLRWLASYISEHPIPDLNSGLRAFHRDCISQYFSILSNRFSFTTTSTLALLADDYLIAYQPIDYYQRTGKSKIRPSHFLDFTILILRMSMMFQPLRIFIPLAVSFGLLGLVKALYDIATLFLRAPEFSWSLIYQPALSTSSILLLLVGLQFLMIGMVADGVVRRFAQIDKPLVPSRAVYEDSTGVPMPAEESEIMSDISD